MIEVKNLSMSYGKKVVLKQLNFHVADGTTVGLLGENGAGKSTTMNLLTGYLKPTSGQIRINGFDLRTDTINAKKSIGYLPEIPPLYKDMKVVEYLRFAAELRRIPNVREEVCRVLSDFGLEEKRFEYIKKLSKGWQQRVGFAYCMLGNPKVLILDEPFVGLDPKESKHVRALIHDLSKAHTIIISSHILSDIEELCSQVIMLKDGQIVMDDAIRTAKSKSNVYRLKIKGDKDKVLDALVNFDLLTEVKLVGEVEQGVFEYCVTSKGKQDIRDNLFTLMAGKHFNVYGIENIQTSLEEVFLSMDKKEEA